MILTRSTSLACLAFMILGPTMFLLMPMYIGAIADTYAYPESRLGLLASADLIGLCLASFTAPLWINKINWRSTVVVTWCAFIVGNYISLSINDYGMLFALRFVTGLATGVAMSVVASVLSFSKKPDRFYAIVVFLQVSYQTISFLVLPDLIAEYLLQGFLWFVIGLQLIVLPLVIFIPAHLKHINHEEELNIESSASRKNCYKVLLAMGLFMLCQAGVFSFVDLMANSNGLTDKEIGLALSISTFAGLLGPLTAAIFADRFGRFKPILVAGIIQLAVLCVFDFASSLVVYTIMLAIFQLFWNMALGYQFGTMVSADVSHRFVAVMPAAQSGGMALGPILCGFALEFGGSPALYLVSGIALFLYMILILPSAKNSC